MTQRQSLTFSRQQLRRLGAALEAATPSRSSMSLMVEASSEGDAQVEKWAVMEMGALGLPMVMDIGLEKKPSPGMLMEGNVFSNKWAVMEFRVWACP